MLDMVGEDGASESEQNPLKRLPDLHRAEHEELDSFSLSTSLSNV